MSTADEMMAALSARRAQQEASEDSKTKPVTDLLKLWLEKPGLSPSTKMTIGRVLEELNARAIAQQNAEATIDQQNKDLQLAAAAVLTLNGQIEELHQQRPTTEPSETALTVGNKPGPPPPAEDVTLVKLRNHLDLLARVLDGFMVPRKHRPWGTDTAKIMDTFDRFRTFANNLSAAIYNVKYHAEVIQKTSSMETAHIHAKDIMGAMNTLSKDDET